MGLFVGYLLVMKAIGQGTVHSGGEKALDPSVLKAGHWSIRPDSAYMQIYGIRECSSPTTKRTPPELGDKSKGICQKEF